ncbi:MAG TPA: hypothetical protein VII73_03435 [Caulobacteraceae bacterium]
MGDGAQVRGANALGELPQSVRAIEGFAGRPMAFAGFQVDGPGVGVDNRTGCAAVA